LEWRTKFAVQLETKTTSKENVRNAAVDSFDNRDCVDKG